MSETWTRRDLALGVVILTLTAGAVKSCAGCINALPKHREVCSTVASVGACDTDGWCGVALEDGAHITARYPTIGKQICRVEHMETPK